ncbi:hypothetical protein E2C01_077430 [Portunus trituberculatus]|uniref:Uncharacterized protein n=1 Tax=Portunus trituberculatus TaxID=210409 RepID=A0A5B7IPP6_PORTR|nr:hypothetical protein [Portunus trituberculatus]
MSDIPSQRWAPCPCWLAWCGAPAPPSEVCLHLPPSPCHAHTYYHHTTTPCTIHITQSTLQYCINDTLNVLSSAVEVLYIITGMWRWHTMALAPGTGGIKGFTGVHRCEGQVITPCGAAAVVEASQAAAAAAAAVACSSH